VRLHILGLTSKADTRREISQLWEIFRWGATIVRNGCRIPVHNCKSLDIAVTIWTIWLTHIHTRTHGQLLTGCNVRPASSAET